VPCGAVSWPCRHRCHASLCTGSATRDAYPASSASRCARACARTPRRRSSWGPCQMRSAPLPWWPDPNGSAGEPLCGWQTIRCLWHNTCAWLPAFKARFWETADQYAELCLALALAFASVHVDGVSVNLTRALLEHSQDTANSTTGPAARCVRHRLANQMTSCQGLWLLELLMASAGNPSPESALLQMQST
jgi:hypothetical protein